MKYSAYAALGGGLIAVMIFINGILASHIGDYNSSLIAHLAGILSTALLLFSKKEKLKYSKNVSLVYYSAGLFGIFIVVFNNICFKALGVSLTLAIGLLGQAVISIIIDTYGIMGLEKVPFENKKLIGLAIIFLGIYLMTISS